MTKRDTSLIPGKYQPENPNVFDLFKSGFSLCSEMKRGRFRSGGEIGCWGLCTEGEVPDEKRLRLGDFSAHVALKVKKRIMRKISFWGCLLPLLLFGRELVADYGRQGTGRMVPAKSPLPALHWQSPRRSRETRFSSLCYAYPRQHPGQESLRN